MDSRIFMEKASKILKVVLLLVVFLSCLSVFGLADTSLASRPICHLQFTLADNACAELPFNHGIRLRDRAPSPECCRWLKMVDHECVCDLLAHLPPFLSIPVHRYNVLVDKSCNVMFSCSSPLQY